MWMSVQEKGLYRPSVRREFSFNSSPFCEIYSQDTNEEIVHWYKKEGSFFSVLLALIERLTIQRVKPGQRQTRVWDL